MVVQLNTVIRQAAVNAGFGFVDATNAQSPFVGHEVCTSNPFFTNVTSSFPFHPNLKGQGAYQDLLTTALQAAGLLDA